MVGFLCGCALLWVSLLENLSREKRPITPSLVEAGGAGFSLFRFLSFHSTFFLFSDQTERTRYGCWGEKMFFFDRPT